MKPPWQRQREDGRQGYRRDEPGLRGAGGSGGPQRILLAIVLGLVLLPSTGCACGPATGPAVTEPPAFTAPAATEAPDAVPAGSIEATLLRVIDGDTIRVRMPGGREERIRYIGIDAPEVAHSGSAGEYLGDEATAHNTVLLKSGPLRLETDVEERDDFGRLLAYVWAGDVFVNERMVRDGYARARNYPPNLARQERLWDAHDEARQAGIGIWGQPDE